MLQLFAIYIVHIDSARSSMQWHISSKAKPFLKKWPWYTCVLMVISKTYRMEGNFSGGNVGKFGKLSMIRQTKTIQISTYN